jgi:hypothetical protein
MNSELVLCGEKMYGKLMTQSKWVILWLVQDNFG